MTPARLENKRRQEARELIKARREKRQALVKKIAQTA